MIYDVIIIGGGITGCMTAYRLAEYNVKAAVVEAADDVAMGATKANSAIVHAGFDAENGTLKAELNVRGCKQMKEIVRKLDVPYKNNTSLVLAFSEEEKEKLQILYDRGVSNGVPELEIIGRDELKKLEPNVSDECVAALKAGTAGIVCPYELCIAAAENANLNGIDFYFDSKITSIEKKDGVFCVSAGEKIFKARFLVNAAGAHSDEIAVIAGEKDFPMHIIPRRGEYMLLDKEQGGMSSATLFMVPSERGKGILVSPTVDGNLIVGPNAYKIDDKDDTATTNAGLSEIAEGAKRIMPGLNLRAVITSFSGVRPTPDTGDFYIKPSKQIPGLLHLAGIESPGLASSPAVGERAVELLEKMGLRLEKKADYIEGRPERIRFRELDDEGKKKIIEKNPLYAKIICRCEQITEGEIVDAVKRPLGARDVDMVKRRTRAGMGRCQGGFCSPRVTEIIARELGIPLVEVTKRGKGSNILTGKKD